MVTEQQGRPISFITIFTIVFFIFLSLGIAFAAPAIIANPISYLLTLLLPGLAITAIVFGQGVTRAFGIGAIVPLVVHFRNTILSKPAWFELQYVMDVVIQQDPVFHKNSGVVFAISCVGGLLCALAHREITQGKE